MKVRNLGRKSLEEVLGKLKELGLTAQPQRRVIDRATVREVLPGFPVTINMNGRDSTCQVRPKSM